MTVRGVLLAVAVVVLSLVAGPALPAQAARKPHPRRPATPCSAGLVALTFDDGPSRADTARLVRILRARGVPATFFMLGSHVRSDPTDARLVSQAGFTIGNHTWSHAVLTHLDNRAVRTELVSTARELRRHGIEPSGLMRPPYGAINARVRKVVHRQRLVPVLWKIDSLDWSRGKPKQIAARVLKSLRPHRENVVLQHDGVRRSPLSVSAVPRIVDVARRRGYCFAALDANGRPTPPVPVMQSQVTEAREAGRVPARLTLTLSEPTSRRVSVHVSTETVTARPHQDFVPVSRTVAFPVGSTRAEVSLPVLDDSLFETTERFTVRFTAPHGLKPSVAARSVTVVSDDAPPHAETGPPPALSPQAV